MLGEKIGEISGKVTMQRVVPNLGGDPKMETSFQANGSVLGTNIKDTGTYWTVFRPDKTQYSEGQGVMITKDGKTATWTGHGVGVQNKDGQDYGPTLCVLGLIDAALGRKDLALEEGRRAIALMPVEKDVLNGSLVLQSFAITAAWAGEKELALQQLETGLRAPTASQMLSYGALKLQPLWDPLRNDPRFQKLCEEKQP